MLHCLDIANLVEQNKKKKETWKLKQCELQDFTGKGKAIPATDREGQLGRETSRLPNFL
jgi:hypothetical protein